MLEILKYFFAGFFAKSLASFDDMAARIPVIAHFTKTKKGRIAFCFGNFLAVTLAIFLARIFAELIKSFSQINIISAILVLILAVIIYFDLFDKKKYHKIKKEEKVIKKRVFKANFYKLVFIGFILSLITLIDDFIVLAPLLLGSILKQIFVIVGIYLSTFIQLLFVIYFSKKISQIKYIKEIAAFGLLILAVLIYFKVF